MTAMVEFRNAEWAVTSHGIEWIKDGYIYSIDVDNLGHVRGGAFPDLPDLPIHIAEKPWAKPGLFIEAFIAALEIHKGRYVPKFKADWLEETRTEAERIHEWATGRKTVWE